MTKWDEAARKAAAEIIDVIDNQKPGCFHEIISKHFAELRATSEKLVELQRRPTGCFVVEFHYNDCHQKMMMSGHEAQLDISPLMVSEWFKKFLADPLVVAEIERSKG